MSKSITLGLPEWANYITQDERGLIAYWEFSPDLTSSGFNADGHNRFIHQGSPRKDWGNIKINLNNHGAYIDAEGILHRCELVPDMLKKQAD